MLKGGESSRGNVIGQQPLPAKGLWAERRSGRPASGCLTCSPSASGWCTALCHPCCSSPAAQRCPRSSWTLGSCGLSQQRSRSPQSLNPSNVGQGLRQSLTSRTWRRSHWGAAPRPGSKLGTGRRAQGLRVTPHSRPRLNFRQQACVQLQVGGPLLPCGDINRAGSHP